jgi:rubrerythrin
MAMLLFVFLVLGSCYFLLKILNEISFFYSNRKKDKQFEDCLKSIIKYQTPNANVESGVCTVCGGSGYVVSKEGDLIDCPSCQKFVGMK